MFLEPEQCGEREQQSVALAGDAAGCRGARVRAARGARSARELHAMEKEASFLSP